MVYLSRLNPYSADGVPQAEDYQPRFKPSNDVVCYKRLQFIDKDIDRYCLRSRKTQGRLRVGTQMVPAGLNSLPSGVLCEIVRDLKGIVVQI